MFCIYDLTMLSACTYYVRIYVQQLYVYCVRYIYIDKGRQDNKYLRSKFSRPLPIHVANELGAEMAAQRKQSNMFVATPIAIDHKDLIHDVSYDFYGKRMATCSSDQSVKVSWCVVWCARIRTYFMYTLYVY